MSLPPGIANVVTSLQRERGDGFIRLDPSGHVVWSDRGVAELVGADAEELTTLEAEELVHRSDLRYLASIEDTQLRVGGVGMWTEIRLRSRRGWVRAEVRQIVVQDDDETSTILLHMRPSDPDRRMTPRQIFALEELRKLADTDTPDPAAARARLSFACEIVRRAMGYEGAAIWTRHGPAFHRTAAVHVSPKVSEGDIVGAQPPETVLRYGLAPILDRLTLGPFGISDRSLMSSSLASIGSFLEKHDAMSWLGASMNPPTARPPLRAESVIGWLELTNGEQTDSASVADGEFLAASIAILCDLLGPIDGRYRNPLAELDPAPETSRSLVNNDAVLDLIDAAGEDQYPRSVTCFRIDIEGTLSQRRPIDSTAEALLERAHQALRTVIKAEDSLVWRRPDGFTVILSDRAGAVNVAQTVQRLRNEIKDCVVQGARMRAFIGVSSRRIDERLTNEQLSDLLKGADSGLIQARRQVGSRVAVANGSSR